MRTEERTYKFNNSSVTIKFGDIVSSKAEVIVSSDDTLLTMSGGVSHAIKKAAGNQISNDTHKMLPAKIGDVVISSAGDLECKYIFHCLTIDDKFLTDTWAGLNVPTEDRVDNIVRSCINRCFQLVSALNIKSIAFPVIGSGSANMPFKSVIEIMADEMFHCLQETNRNIEIELFIYNALEMSKLDIFEVFAFKSAISSYLKKQEGESIKYERKPITLSKEDIDYYRNSEHDVFISYKHEEKKQAFEIQELIEGWGIKTWIDKDGIFSSYDFKEVIEKAIENTKIVIFLSSALSNQSDYVKKEIQYAIKLNKRIIPIMLDNAPFANGIRMDLTTVDQVVDYANQEEFQKKLKTSIDYILGTLI